MTHNPLIVVEGDGWIVWCKTCGWESGYTPFEMLARRAQEQHQEDG